MPPSTYVQLFDTCCDSQWGEKAKLSQRGWWGAVWVVPIDEGFATLTLLTMLGQIILFWGQGGCYAFKDI